MKYLLLSLSCFALASYSVLVYPLLVRGLAGLRPRPWRRGEFNGPIAHVITVHNEEQRIRGKLENALSIAGPSGGTEIIVASDGSTDGTSAVVAEFSNRGVRWIECPRRGKESAQVAAIRATQAPIVVFSDASTTLAPGSVLEILSPFSDRDVAAVSGTDRVEVAGNATGEDLYVDYEMLVRRSESLAGSLVGLSGCFFAVRREVADELHEDVPSDLGSALLCIAQGRRAVAEPGAVCTYVASGELEREFSRKRRTVLRGMRCLWRFRTAMSPRRPIAAWQIVSHKVMRFVSPILVVAGLGVLAIGAIAGEKAPTVAFVLLVLAALAGVVSWVVPVARRVPAVRATGFVVLSMCAVLAAWMDLILGRNSVTWTPTARGEANRER